MSSIRHQTKGNNRHHHQRLSSPLSLDQSSIQLSRERVADDAVTWRGFSFGTTTHGASLRKKEKNERGQERAPTSAVVTKA